MRPVASLAFEASDLNVHFHAVIPDGRVVPRARQARMRRVKLVRLSSQRPHPHANVKRDVYACGVDVDARELEIGERA